MATTNQKSSGLSMQRGSKTGHDNYVMFAKLEAMFEKHFGQGLLKTPYPHASTVFALH
tara:strand:- start:279 stop:452 length:174 start_codon:yes stop_codon:yes gene_type:complete